MAMKVYNAIWIVRCLRLNRLHGMNINYNKGHWNVKESLQYHYIINDTEGNNIYHFNKNDNNI